jgi:membrane fusion protein (multidrug efflux system)
MTTPPASPENGNGKRNPVPLILGILALAGVAWAGKTWLYNRTHENTDDAQVDGSILPVVAKVGGFVRRVLVVENQRVKAGDVMVQIDDAEYATRLAQTDADLSAAASIAGGRGIDGQAGAQVRSAQSQRLVVDAQIQSARSAQQKSAADLSRAKELVAKQIVSKQALDAAQAAFDEATANLQALERQASTAAAQLSNAEAGSRLAVARYAGAKAARDNASLQLSYTAVAAPLAGTVSRKQVEPGQLVQAGQPLLTLVADTSVWITANFKETQLARLRVGQPVSIDVDAYPGCVAEGRVQSLGAATGAKFALLPPDNSTGNFTKVVQRVPVRIEVTKGCGSDRPLRQGISVVAHVSTK